LATVYSLTGELSRAPDGAGMQTQGQYVDGPRVSFSGGAGLLSTTRDYARFLQMLLNGGELNGARLLSPTTVDLMTQNHVGDIDRGPGMGFGLGFSIRENVGDAGQPGSVGEFGWGGAYHSTYWVDPVENLVVVYLTQVIPAAGLDDQAKLRSLIYASTFSPRPRRSPSFRLRLNGEKQVTTRSPSPLNPAKVSACAPHAIPSRLISASARVTNAALLLSPSPTPSPTPAAIAITFFNAPPNSTPTKSVEVYTRNSGR
jgi:hypothetical protein